MESYLDLNQPVGTDGLYVETLGDRGLSPERILTVEGGLHDETLRWMQADLAAYWSRVTDLIYLQDIELSLSPFDPASAGFQAGTTRFGNLDPVYRALGLEADVHLFPLDGLDLYANGTLQRMTEEVAGLEGQPRRELAQPLPGRPQRAPAPARRPDLEAARLRRRDRRAAHRRG
jgi:outer membrane receptor protein involved in Fe transport